MDPRNRTEKCSQVFLLLWQDIHKASITLLFRGYLKCWNSEREIKCLFKPWKPWLYLISCFSHILNAPTGATWHSISIARTTWLNLFNYVKFFGSITFFSYSESSSFFFSGSFAWFYPPSTLIRILAGSPLKGIWLNWSAFPLWYSSGHGKSSKFILSLV